MPELPEVETTCRGIQPHVCNQQIEQVILRRRTLRWPISDEISLLAGNKVIDVSRRGKYILMQLDCGSLIWHLGMSGSMKILPIGSAVETHEHVEFQFGNGKSLKFRDPRRFGALLYSPGNPLEHKLLCNLGPEPLGDEFTSDYLYRSCRDRSAAIKTVIMNGHVVVGVGNIYACEALYQAGIRPTRAAGKISKARIRLLVEHIRDTLACAIDLGGTSLQDFTQVDGKPGYFGQSLKVYGNKGNCASCGSKIKQVVQAQRSSYYCPECQS
jgi:formamidopyrimidine-DNA glycosylase